VRAGLLRGAARTVIIMSAPSPSSRATTRLMTFAFHHRRVRERHYDRRRLRRGRRVAFRYTFRSTDTQVAFRGVSLRTRSTPRSALLHSSPLPSILSTSISKYSVPPGGMPHAGKPFWP
jgi:hypothetical protein